MRAFLFLFLLLPVLPVLGDLYDRDTHVIMDGNETLTTLADEGYIEKVSDSCFLRTPLHVHTDGVLYANGSDCSVLYMYPESYIRIAGSAYFVDIKVTSLDPSTYKPLTLTREEYSTKRPHIYTKAPAKYVHMENSEFSHLGYYNASEEGSAWGVSFWGLASGYVGNSSFHDNYFGFYTYETLNVTVENSEAYDNLEYGLDFHDYSDNFIIRNNVVYDNGNHGIIFSKFCDHNLIANNRVYDHTQNAFVKGVEQDYGIHGIMLHKNSTNNTVRNNVLSNNRVGIFLYESDHNTVRENIILDDLEDGIYVDRSFHNEIRNNVVFDTEGYGMYVYRSEDNEYTGNYFEKDVVFKEVGDIYREELNEKFLPDELEDFVRNGDIRNKDTLHFDGPDEMGLDDFGGLAVNSSGDSTGDSGESTSGSSGESTDSAGDTTSDSGDSTSSSDAADSTSGSTAGSGAFLIQGRAIQAGELLGDVVFVKFMFMVLVSIIALGVIVFEIRGEK